MKKYTLNEDEFLSSTGQTWGPYTDGTTYDEGYIGRNDISFPNDRHVGRRIDHPIGTYELRNGQLYADF